MLAGGTGSSWDHRGSTDLGVPDRFRSAAAATPLLGIIGGRPTWACQTDSGRQPQRLRCLGSSGVDRPGRARPIPVGSRSDSAVWDHRGSTDLGVPDRFRSAAAATPPLGSIGGRPTWGASWHRRSQARGGFVQVRGFAARRSSGSSVGGRALVGWERSTRRPVPLFTGNPETVPVIQKNPEAHRRESRTGSTASQPASPPGLLASRSPHGATHARAATGPATHARI